MTATYNGHNKLLKIIQPQSCLSLWTNIHQITHVQIVILFVYIPVLCWRLSHLSANLKKSATTKGITTYVHFQKPLKDVTIVSYPADTATQYAK